MAQHQIELVKLSALTQIQSDLEAAVAEDAAATAADRIATGEDRVATAADRVQTGLDRASATASANTALVSAESALTQRNAVDAALALTSGETASTVAHQASQAAHPELIDSVYDFMAAIALQPLFANSELGGYWNPRGAYEDFTLATRSTNGGPVGCIINQVRGAPVVGDNLASALGGWTAGTGWSVANGVATKTAGTASVLSLAVTLVDGGVYAIHWTQTRSAGTLTPRFTGGTAVTGTATNSSAGFTQYLIANSGSTTIEFSADAAFAGTVSLVQLRRVQNSPALIFSTANKPTLRITTQTRRAWLDSAIGLMSAPFAASLGSSCTIARLDPELGVVWSESQTIGTSLNVTAAYDYNGPVFAINRAVTAAEKLVVERLMLRERPAIGANMISNGTFDSDVSGWELTLGGGSVSWNNGAADFLRDGIGPRFENSAGLSASPGSMYFGRFDVLGFNSPGILHLTVLIGSAVLPTGTRVPGTHKFVAIASISGKPTVLISNNQGSYTLDNIAAWEIL